MLLATSMRLARTLPILFACPGIAWGGSYRGPFAGLFYGQGRGCWGPLFVRTKTIVWNNEDFTCRRTTHTIVAKDLHTPFRNYDHIVFKLNHVSKGCPFPYIGLYYYQTKYEITLNDQIPEYARLYRDWSVSGFPDQKTYKTYPYKKNVDGREWSDRDSVLSCGFMFGGKPFPYGKPLD